MKKPIGKQRRKYLKKFLLGNRKGWDAGHNFYYGLLPESPAHKQGRMYWLNRYYTIYYDIHGKDQEARAGSYGYIYSPLNDDDIKYIESLVNIDPFLAAEENKEYVAS